MRLDQPTPPRRDLEARTGRLEQAGGLRRMRLSEGVGDGVEVIEVDTGAGLCYSVVPSRGMDIGRATFGGASLAWLSGSGTAHPAYFDRGGISWLRTAAGGLLMTCGMTAVGSPCEDAGETLGIHGTAHHLPASEVCAAGTWVGDRYEMHISGQLTDAMLFGHHVTLRRTIRSVLGENRIRLRDEVRNAGFAPAPLMMLYHFNFGWPLLDTHTRMTFPSQTVRGREADLPLEGHDTWHAPEPGYAERVYYHEDIRTAPRGDARAPWAEAVVENPAFPILGGTKPVAVRLAWDTRTLPKLVQWKMAGEGAHVLGIEPANCYVEGRDVERARGTLRDIEPGETVTFELELTMEIQ